MKQRSQSVIRGTSSTRTSIFGMAVVLLLLLFSNTSLAQDAVEERSAEQAVIDSEPSKQLDQVAKEPVKEARENSGGDAARNSRRAARLAADAPFLGKAIAQMALDCDLEVCRNGVAIVRFKDLGGGLVGQS